MCDLGKLYPDLQITYSDALASIARGQDMRPERLDQLVTGVVRAGWCRASVLSVAPCSSLRVGSSERLGFNEREECDGS